MTDQVPSKDGVSGRTVSVWELPSRPLPPRELKTYTFEELRETFDPGDLVTLLLDEIDRLRRPAHEREPPHCSTCGCGLAPEPESEHPPATHGRQRLGEIPAATPAVGESREAGEAAGGCSVQSVQLVRLICMDCQAPFDGHPGDNVCETCWENFDGMTVEELTGAAQQPAADADDAQRWRTYLKCYDREEMVAAEWNGPAAITAFIDSQRAAPPPENPS